MIQVFEKETPKTKGLSQNDMVLNHLKQYGKITNWEAIERYGITRLGSRIFDLRERGHIISSKLIMVENRYGRKVNISEYRLVKEKV